MAEVPSTAKMDVDTACEVEYESEAIPPGTPICSICFIHLNDLKFLSFRLSSKGLKYKHIIIITSVIALLITFAMAIPSTP